jgi:hypothetical protein
MKALILIGFVIVAGCSDVHHTTPNLAWLAQAKRCIDVGGVPIRSSWDGELKTCQFPPAYKPALEDR